jgi:hypothetical protein
MKTKTHKTRSTRVSCSHDKWGNLKDFCVHNADGCCTLRDISIIGGYRGECAMYTPVFTGWRRVDAVDKADEGDKEDYQI